jgi:hypothetical protein
MSELHHCQLNTGNFIPSGYPPLLTPYAQAIADLYRVQVPQYITIPTTLTGVALQQKTVVTDPFENDVLIMGAVIQPGDDADNGQSIFLNLFNRQDSINWVVPNIVGAAPLTSFGGNGSQPTSVMRLPEAYFLPKHTRLQHNFTQPTGAAVTGGSITWVGIQLYQPLYDPMPECVNVNGQSIRIGSRMPWFAALPIGVRSFTAGVLTFTWAAGASLLYVTPPVDCNLEVHDLHTTAFDTSDVTNDPNNLMVKISTAGRRDMWTPDLSPFTGVFANRTQIYGAMPMSVPLILYKNQRLQFRFQNNSAGSVVKRMAVVRGVRLCEF